MRLAGRLNVPAQTIEMESSTAGGETLPLAVRFRCSDYLSQPRWGVALNWNRFPAGPVLDLARQMGADLPPNREHDRIARWRVGLLGAGKPAGRAGLPRCVDRIAGFSAHALRAGAPDFRPRPRQAGARAVRTAQDETAQLEADYDWKAQSLDLTISTDAMRLESLRAQAALAAIPWLEQVAGGTWKGQLRYQIAAGSRPRTGPHLAKTGWTGAIDLRDASFHCRDSPSR